MTPLCMYNYVYTYAYHIDLYPRYLPLNQVLGIRTSTSPGASFCSLGGIPGQEAGHDQVVEVDEVGWAARGGKFTKEKWGFNKNIPSIS